MDLFTFIQWCFRDSTAGFWTLIVGWGFFSGVAVVVGAFRGRE